MLTEPIPLKPQPQSSYRVHELFHTWQGEGVHMGRAAFFIRLYGCPLQCAFCDSAGTWHKDYRPAEIEVKSALELAQLAAQSNADVCVITGGEPAMYDLTALTEQLHARSMKVHVETSGAFIVRGAVDWLTVSPKKAKPALASNITNAHELKLIIETPEDVDYWIERLSELVAQPFIGWASARASVGRQVPTVWLHPEWSKRGDADVLKRISNAVKECPRAFRAGYQLHKLFQVDFLDSRTASPVPLGGEEKNGY